MTVDSKCRKCGAPLHGGARDGVCPKCLLEQVLGGDEEDVSVNPAPSPPVTEAVGTIIGNFKLLQKIGEGGCGVVFMAEQIEPIHRTVALKIIKPGMDSNQVLARFEAERQALALMDHPNIAKILDGGATPNGRPYFAMELVKGIQITRYCDQKDVSIRERLDLFIKVCQAIQHAHQKGIIHRDIKPSNILVTLRDGVPVPKVIDFGIAKATQAELTDKTIYSQYHQFIGTPAYMSPEQAEMRRLDIDTRSDIYSLGVLLYELLTGTTPFDTKELLGSGLDEMRRIIREREPVRPSTRIRQTSLMSNASARSTLVTRHSSLPTDLDWIVLKCLEKDRARRYETANGVATDIQRHLQHEAVIAAPPSLVYRMGRFSRRNRAALITVVLFLLVLIAGTLTSWVQAVRASANARLAETTLADLETNLYAADIYRAQYAMRDGNFGLARESLAAHLPRYGVPDVRGFEWAYFWSLCEGDKWTSWHADSKLINSVAVHPSGSLIASGSWEHRAKIWDATSQQLLLTLSDADCVAFSADGELLLTASQMGSVRVFRVGTWERIARFATGDPPAERAFAQLAASPTEPIVAVCTDGNFFGGDGSVHLYNYLSGEEVAKLPESGSRLAFSADGRILVTGSAHGTIKVWEVESQQMIGTLGPVTGVAAIALSPGGRLLATTEYWSPEVRLWDLVHHKELQPLKGHLAMVWAVTFSPDGRFLASSSSDQTIRLWKAESGESVARFVGHESEVWSLAFSPSGEFLCSGGKDEAIAIWPPMPPDPAPTLRMPNRPVNLPLLSPDSRKIATLNENSILAVGDLQTGEAVGVFPGENAGLWFSPDSRRLLTLSSRNELHWCDVGGEGFVTGAALKPQPGVIIRAIASHDGSLVATAGEDSGLRTWAVDSGKLIAQLESGNQEITAMAFSPDAMFLAVGVGDAIELHQLGDHPVRTVLRGHKDGISCVTFSPDGILLASSSVDNTVKIWSVRDKRELATLRGHREGVLGVAFSPDGRTLATASADQSLRLWNLATGREMASIHHDNPIVYVGFTFDGSCLVYECDHNILYPLHVPSMGEIDAALMAPPSSQWPRH